MGSMHSRLELLDHTARRQAAFYTARARGGAALIVTGGYAPSPDGRIDETTEILDAGTDLAPHRFVTDAVHGAGAFICAQILHAGRYAKVPTPVGAGTEPSPINRREIRALEDSEVEGVIDSFVEAARAALDAGYDVKASGVTLDRFCGSGITTVALATAQIMSGMEDCIVAGGCEMMSYTAATADPKNPPMMDAGNLHLREMHPQSQQGCCADAIATLEGISREAVDQLAVVSQERADRARKRAELLAGLQDPGSLELH